MAMLLCAHVTLVMLYGVCCRASLTQAKVCEFELSLLTLASQQEVLRLQVSAGQQPSRADNSSGKALLGGHGHSGINFSFCPNTCCMVKRSCCCVRALLATIG